MHDAVPVRRFETAGDLSRQVERGGESQRTRFHQVPDGLAFDKGHGEEEAPLMFADLEYGTDVGMVDACGGLRLLHEALLVGLPQRSRREEFQRDGSGELGILGFIHDAHAAFAKLAGDAVVGDG